ncbi:Qat anti-phage system associated protein QatB [Paraburkholderia diazotrophica]|uniref:Uncharacterized protein n=1 Tax=Paraburkholderia diazotrophica TaxID=667676 RepID=A0A1H7DWE4_9BURK|nr:Qat anti-phage system associated protein QatB [Paraburkholderia diazotrophica]SEK06063.1 hypothetical protein SAMN05192539_103627 [Paraburkholderia diazotrophica]
MGTSTSSTGPSSGVSLDPPWLDDVVGEIGSGSTVVPNDGDPPAPPSAPNGDAPPNRYGDARREFGKFARTGDTRHLRNAVAHYSRRGSGGASATAGRMRASTSAGAALFSFLNAVSQGTTGELRKWVDDLRASNPSAEDVVDAIVRELAPPGGSADEESFRDAMDLAVSELIRDDPTIDPLSMGVDDIWELLKGFLAIETGNRLCFDLGPVFEGSQLDPRTVVLREKEMRRFLKNEIGAHVDMLRGSVANPSRSQLDSILQDALKMTFELFEADL